MLNMRPASHCCKYRALGMPENYLAEMQSVVIS